MISKFRPKERGGRVTTWNGIFNRELSTTKRSIVHDIKHAPNEHVVLRNTRGIILAQAGDAMRVEPAAKLWRPCCIHETRNRKCRARRGSKNNTKPSAARLSTEGIKHAVIK
jgi:hypothetical protein